MGYACDFCVACVNCAVLVEWLGCFLLVWLVCGFIMLVFTLGMCVGVWV